MEILVIGTEPPCIRCQSTYKFAKDVAQQFPDEIQVRKISLRSEEAKKYGKIATAHDIAELATMTFNKEKIDKLAKEIAATASDEEKHGTAKYKLKEFEEKFISYREKAEKMGYLMTPVLVVNGKVKAMGYVPNKEKIKQLIEGELRLQVDHDDINRKY